MPGMFGYSPPQKMAGDPGGLMRLAQTPQIKPPRPGFNDPGGLGGKLGQLGGLLMASAGNPAGGAMLRMFHDQQQDLAAQKRAEMQRQFERDDWIWKKEWERDNPMPRAPHYFESNDGDIYAVGDDGAPKRLFDDPTPKVEHIIAGDGMGGQRIVPIVNGVPQLGGPIGNPNIPAPGTIIDDPRKGGASPGGSRPF